MQSPVSPLENNHNISPRRWLVSFFALSILFVALNAAAQETPENRILVLHGGWSETPWEAGFNNSLREWLDENGRQDILLGYQYLGFSLNGSAAGEEQFAEHLRYLNSTHSFSMVITALSSAGQFVLQRQEELFPEIPKVYVASGFEGEDLQRLDPMSFIVKNAHREAISETLRQITRLLPETRSIEVVAGVSIGDSYYVNRLRESAREEVPELQLNFHLGKSPSEAGIITAGLPANSAIMFLPHEELNTGTQQDLVAVFPAVIANSAVPVFSFINVLMGTGIIGGNLTSAGNYAQNAGDIVIQYFSSEPLSTLENEVAGTAQTSYDWRQLQKWNISEDRLPASAEILYRPQTLWDSNPFAVIIGSNLLALMLVIIVFLIVNLRRTKRAQLVLATSETELRESEQRYRLLADNSMDVIWVWEHAKNAFTYVSPSIEQLLGFTPSEALGLPLNDILTAESQELILSGMFNPEDSGFMEIEHRHRDGSTIWCEIGFQPIKDESGAIISSIGVTRNISDRKQAEDERKAIEDHLRQSQKFESLGTLAGGIAHDFNNMLTSINGYAELASFELEKDSKTRNMLGKLLSVSDKAKMLVDHILTFSRQTESKKDLLSLGKVLHGSIEMLEAVIPKHIELDVNIAEEGLHVLGDPNQLEQVIINIVTNAYQALEDNGNSISLVLGRESFRKPQSMQYGEVAAAHYARLLVKDNGIGLDENKISRIFEPFYTSKEMGNGLGLAIVHGIVMDHGGAIEVVSQTGVGTSFFVYFPLTEEAEPVDAPESYSEKAIELNKKILIVDDQPEVLDVLSSMIGFLGCDCLAESDPIKAESIIDELGDSLHMVITDYSMASMTGIELIQRSRVRHPDLRFVLSTGFGKDISDNLAKEEGAFAILPKPYNMQDLRDLIQSSL